jgi:beta-galactosidase
MYDHERGYHEETSEVGIMDLYRLKKFSYEFYRSQRSYDPDKANSAVVFIASHWTPQSSPLIRVFSNLENLKLFHNNTELDEVSMPRDAHHPCPSRCFKAPAFSPGTLSAKGFNDGKVVAQHRVSTPSEGVAFKLVWDTQSVLPQLRQKDQCFLYVQHLDANGQIDVHFNGEVQLKNLSEELEVFPAAVTRAEAGIASFLVQWNRLSSISTLSMIEAVCCPSPKPAGMPCHA